MKKKILKKITAVVLLAMVLISCFALPMFALEWESNYNRYYAEPILRLDSFIRYSGTLEETDYTISSITSAGDLNFLYNTNGYTDMNESLITNFGEFRNGNVDVPQSDGTSRMWCQTEASNLWERMSYVYPTTYLKYATSYHADSPYADTHSSSGIDNGYSQFSGGYAPTVFEFVTGYLDSTTERSFSFYASRCSTYVDFVGSSLGLRIYNNTSDGAGRVPLNTLYTFTGSVEYKTVNDTYKVVNFSDTDINNHEGYLYPAQTGWADASYVEVYPFTNIFSAVTADPLFDANTPITLINVEFKTTQPIRGMYLMRSASVFDRATAGGKVSYWERSTEAIPLSIYNYGSINPELVDDIDAIGGFLSSALGGFFEMTIVPGVTLGGIFATVICIALFLTFLKIFAGG